MTSRSRDGMGSLDLYLKEISEHPLIDREEEVVLAGRIRDGDQEAVKQLVAANLRFVVSVARRYRNQGVSIPDLVNEGNVGLMRAARKFDETKGVRFISYAVWWIRQAMLQAIAEQSRIVRVPIGRVDRANLVARKARLLSQSLGREATADEIAADLELPLEQIMESLSVRFSYLSLDAPVADDEDTSLVDLIPDSTGESPHEAAQRQALKEVLESSLTHLPEREATVLRLYFGLDGEDPKTLEFIGQRFGVSRERVRQIKDRALTRLRMGSTGHVLQSFFGQ